jgi:hypothetical protein
MGMNLNLKYKGTFQQQVSAGNVKAGVSAAGFSTC